MVFFSHFLMNKMNDFFEILTWIWPLFRVVSGQEWCLILSFYLTLLREIAKVILRVLLKRENRWRLKGFSRFSLKRNEVSWHLAVKYFVYDGEKWSTLKRGSYNVTPLLSHIRFTWVFPRFPRFLKLIFTIKKKIPTLKGIETSRLRSRNESLTNAPRRASRIGRKFCHFVIV